jgi:hypothetical protein
MGQCWYDREASLSSAALSARSSLVCSTMLFGVSRQRRRRYLVAEVELHDEEGEEDHGAGKGEQKPEAQQHC